MAKELSVAARRRYLKLSLAAMAIAVHPSGLSRALAYERDEAGRTFHRQLRWRIVLTNPFAEELKDQVLWMYLPAAITPTQRVTAVNASSEHRTTRDSLGHSIIRFDVPSFPPLGQKPIAISTDVTVSDSPKLWPLDEPRLWLGCEQYIETNDPTIRSLAGELRRSSDLESAHAIFGWVKENIRYAGYDPGDVGAAEGLARRRGDCTEYAYLAAALARAQGIPARMVGGYVVDRSALLEAKDYHNWTEIYAEGTWRVLDAQKGNWLDPADQYVAFRYYRADSTNPVGQAHRFRVQGRMQARL